jgi:hypothetical protein
VDKCKPLAVGTVLNTASGTLTISNRGPAGTTAPPVPPACLDPAAWGACATTHLMGALPLRGISSLLITAAAVVCTDACPTPPVYQEDALNPKPFASNSISIGASAASTTSSSSYSRIVHLEVSDAITLTGSAHLLHGNSASTSGRRTAATAALWLVAPTLSITDRSSLVVVGAMSVDGGPTARGSVVVEGSSSLKIIPKVRRCRLNR